MKTSKKILAFCLTAAMLVSTAVLPASANNGGDVPSFSDVHEDDYFAYAVSWAVEQGVTSGTSDSTFSPYDTVTRAQAMTFLWAAAGRPEPASSNSAFVDVSDTSAYYYKPVLWASEQGITSGVDATHFGVNETLAYDQILAFLCKSSGGTLSADWSQSALDWAEKSYLTSGLTFNAKSGCPRADVVTFLFRNFMETTAIKPQNTNSSASQNSDTSNTYSYSYSTTTTTTSHSTNTSTTSSSSSSVSSAAPSHSTNTTTTPSVSNSPNTSDTSSPAITTLANGEEITDDNIRNIIYGLQGDYPEGMYWTNDNLYYSSVLHIYGYGCVGFALICSDAVFGDLPESDTYTDFDSIRVGDMLRVNHDTHTVIVLEKRSDSVIVAEGNYNSSIHRGREITSQELLNGNFYGSTRYPS